MVDAGLLVAVVGSAQVEGRLDVDGVLAALEERETAVENIWVEDLGDDAVDQPEYAILILQDVGAVIRTTFRLLRTVPLALWPFWNGARLSFVPQEYSIVHFEDNFSFNTHRQDQHRHHKLAPNLL